MSGKYPSSVYRVSLKAIIRNSKGELLLAKEDDTWFFPGGGIEHGESGVETLKRELYEEALIDEHFSAKPVGVETVFIERRNTWLMWIFYEVKLPDSFYFAVGDVQEVAFWNPDVFKNSDNIWEQIVYKWASKQYPQ